MKIPKVIYFGKEKIKVVIKMLPDEKLGYIEFGKKHTTIFIHKDQPKIGKVIILMHELIHFVDETNVINGIYKKSIKEDQITGISGLLSLTLMRNKLFKGISIKEIAKFLGEKQ